MVILIFKNIIFDVGDVLIDFHWERSMREHGFLDEVISCFDTKILHSEAWEQFDLGILSDEEIFEKFRCAAPQYKDEIDRFLEFKDEIVTPFPMTRKWLLDLKKRGFRIYLLSNYPRSFFQAHAQKRFNFMDLIDGAVVSYEVGITKPDERIYRHLLQKYSLLPNECIFIDDRLQNVAAAKTLGMQAIHFHNQLQAMKALDDILALCFTKEGQECVYEGRVMSLWKDRLMLPDKTMVEYDLVKQKGGACVLPIDATGNIYLVEQYRNTLNSINLELPAGCYDSPNEDKLHCAIRELKEELGIVANTWKYFTEIITDIGISDEKVAIYFASDLDFGECHRDPNEFIRCVKLPYEKALSMVYTGEIIDAKTVVAILGYQNDLKQK